IRAGFGARRKSVRRPFRRVPQRGKMMLETASAMRQWWALMLVLTWILGCEKPAPEPAPQLLPSPTPKSGFVPDAPGRRPPPCVVPTPSAPPPAPPFRVDPKCPADPAGGSPMVPVGHVAFPESKNAPRLEVELMLTNENQARG